MPPRMNRGGSTWPELPYSAWKETYTILHLWTQIVGKIRLAQVPWLNHSWHVLRRRRRQHSIPPVDSLRYSITFRTFSGSKDE